MQLHDLTTKQIMQALNMVTGETAGRMASRMIGLNRLRREMEARSMTEHELFDQMGLTAAEETEEEPMTSDEDEQESDPSPTQSFVNCSDREFERTAKRVAKQRGTTVLFETKIVARFGDDDMAEWSTDEHGNEGGTWASALFDAPQRAPRKARTAVDRKPRTGTKQEAVIALLRRPQGATLAEICDLTGWLPHTARAFVTATVGKKLGMPLISEKVEGRGRQYRLATEEAEAAE